MAIGLEKMGRGLYARTMTAPNVLVLAGQRPGKTDALATAAGVSHKCLVEVEGQTLLGRVLDTIDRALPESPIFLSIETDARVEGEPSFDRLHDAGRLRIVAAQANLVDSVHRAAQTAGYPLIITTADNALLTPEALRSMVATAAAAPSDAMLGMARKADIQAAHPGGKGRYYEFRDGGYSNCNLFWLGTPASLAAVEAFREGGQFLKQAGRMVKAVGPLNLLLYRSRLLSLEQGFKAVSSRLGADIRPLVFDDGRLAIDVDDERSKQMVEELLSANTA